MFQNVFGAFALEFGILLGFAAFLVLLDRPAFLVAFARVDVAFGMPFAIRGTDANGMFFTFGMAFAVSSALALFLDLYVAVLARSSRTDFAADSGAV